jgi:hypothetical protein
MAVLPSFGRQNTGTGGVRPATSRHPLAGLAAAQIVGAFVCASYSRSTHGMTDFLGAPVRSTCHGPEPLSKDCRCRVSRTMGRGRGSQRGAARNRTPCESRMPPHRRDQQIKQARHIDRTSATSRSICARVLLTSAFDRSVSHTNVCRLASSATFFLK